MPVVSVRNAQWTWRTRRATVVAQELAPVERTDAPLDSIPKQFRDDELKR